MDLDTWFYIGDVDPVSYGGKWIRRIDSLCFEVVTLENWEDLVGEKEAAEIGFSHVIDRGTVDFSMMSADDIRAACQSVGVSLEDFASWPISAAEAAWSYGLKDVDSSENANELWEVACLVNELGQSDARMSDEDRESFRSALMKMLDT